MKFKNYFLTLVVLAANTLNAESYYYTLNSNNGYFIKNNEEVTKPNKIINFSADQYLKGYRDSYGFNVPTLYYSGNGFYIPDTTLKGYISHSRVVQNINDDSYFFINYVQGTNYEISMDVLFDFRSINSNYSEMFTIDIRNLFNFRVEDFSNNGSTNHKLRMGSNSAYFEGCVVGCNLNLKTTYDGSIKRYFVNNVLQFEETILIPSRSNTTITFSPNYIHADITNFSYKEY